MSGARPDLIEGTKPLRDIWINVINLLYFTQVYIKNTEKCNDKYYSFVYEAKCVEKPFFSFVLFYLLFHLVILLSVLFFKVLFPTIGAFLRELPEVCARRGAKVALGIPS